MKRLLVLSVLLTSTSAQAYNFLYTSYGRQKKWTQNQVSYYLANSCDPRIADRDGCTQALRNGFERWSRLSCSSLSFRYAGAAQYITTSDNQNSVGWLTDWPPSYGQDALAVTIPAANERTGEMYDADIAFNPNKTFSIDNTPDTIDVESVMTHEVGHLLGLDHSATFDATMFFATGPNELYRRSLHDDDIQGACAIYPNGRPTDPECTTDADCAEGFEVCEAGRCSGGSGPGSRQYGESCDPNDNCAEAYQCIRFEEGSRCGAPCEPGKPTTCPNGDLCRQLSNGDGICHPGTAPEPAGFGAVCGSGSACQSRLCAAHPVTGISVCTTSCDPRRPSTCPDDAWCAANANGSGNCFQGTPPSRFSPVGARCLQDHDCITNWCLASEVDPSRKYCTQVCDSINPCKTLRCQLTSASKGICRPAEFGEPCGSGEHCISGLCLTDPVDPSRKYCTEQCASTCADGYACQRISTGENACVKQIPLEPGTRVMGEACAEDTDCASLICGPDAVCTHLCEESGCEAGYECREHDGEQLCLRVPEEEGGFFGCSTGPGATGFFGLFVVAFWGAARARETGRKARA